MRLSQERSGATPRDLHTACGQSAEGHRASGAGKYWDCKMTLRVPGVGKAPALRVFQLTFSATTEEHSLSGADGDTADGDGEPRTIRCLTCARTR